jgi:predicted metal-dependent HD superfamily phosphohydrolase
VDNTIVVVGYFSDKFIISRLLPLYIRRCLGQPWGEYTQYAKNVRKEYAIYPDLLYNPGRRKVLNHFLSMERIFKTSHFFEKFEATARLNMSKEMEGM